MFASTLMNSRNGLCTNSWSTLDSRSVYNIVPDDGGIVASVAVVVAGAEAAAAAAAKDGPPAATMAWCGPWGPFDVVLVPGIMPEVPLPG